MKYVRACRLLCLHQHSILIVSGRSRSTYLSALVDAVVCIDLHAWYLSKTWASSAQDCSHGYLRTWGYANNLYLLAILAAGSRLPPGDVSYDPDVFDSMAVINSEMWNEGDEDEADATLIDLLPHVSTSINDICDNGVTPDILHIIKILVYDCVPIKPIIIHLTDYLKSWGTYNYLHYNNIVTIVVYPPPPTGCVWPLHRVPPVCVPESSSDGSTRSSHTHPRTLRPQHYTHHWWGQLHSSASSLL